RSPLPALAIAPETKLGTASSGLGLFYQAEAGIRPRTVTGVQTCALPICLGQEALPGWQARQDDPARMSPGHQGDARLDGGPVVRSEERRVGKESRQRTFTKSFKRYSNRTRNKTRDSQIRIRKRSAMNARF